MRDALPNASFIGFTGTPIEQNDANTRAVFGEYVSVYDIQQAVIDNRAIATQEVIDELIQLAKEMQAATQRGEDLGLNEDEICFYDALAMNESAVQAMGNDELKVIAAELVTSVRQSATIDWTVRESARAKFRVMVRRILKKHGYPPDLQDEATKLVLEQAEVLCAD